MDSYPFSAVIGQTRLKLALILATIDMKMGGVLISGPRGCAKTTLARGLTSISAVAAQPFVTLPLSATEEKVVGSLQLESVLQQGRVEFQPGLLHRAHQGILFIDEVNLLPDPLVDVLLDVAASGINTVERDGVSHCHAAQFVLIGTMNPEEGELRPQLLDRFGLCVLLTENYSIEQRMEVVQRRLAFDDNPPHFLEQYAAEETELQQRIMQAREILPRVTMALATQRYLAEQCQTANVEGVRADITLFRAARAYAAWQQRTQIEPADVDSVAEFALQHRIKPQLSTAPENSDVNHHQSSPSNRSSSCDASDTLKDSDSDNIDSATSLSSFTQDDNADWGGMEPVDVLTGAKHLIKPFDNVATLKKNR